VDSGRGRMTTIDRFWQKVNKTSGCWFWTGALTWNGYGRFHNPALKTNRKQTRAYIFAWELQYGPKKKDMDLDHLCKVRHCCNPDHLEMVTRHVNLLRGEKCQRTHCPQGHAYTPENTFIPKGRTDRNCRTCKRHRDRKVAKHV